MIDFSPDQKAITIPEGTVFRILGKDSVLWLKDYLNYTLSSDGTYYTCDGVRDGYDDTEFVILGEYNGIPVTAIGASAFYQHGRITSVTIREGITSIGNDAFREVSGASKLVNIKLPDSLKEIGDGTFRYAAKMELAELPAGITKILDQAFYGCSRVTFTALPVGITTIYSQCFRGCSRMALTELPPKLKGIETQGFYTCSALAIKKIPATVTSIASSAFYNCTGLTELTFEGTPKTINASAFNGCTNLKTINVPWAEGAVADAPWGATNAVINYNYTG